MYKRPITVPEPRKSSLKIKIKRTQKKKRRNKGIQNAKSIFLKYKK